jgi:hypothetical protein
VRRLGVTPIAHLELNGHVMNVEPRGEAIAHLGEDVISGRPFVDDGVRRTTRNVRS